MKSRAPLLISALGVALGACSSSSLPDESASSASYAVTSPDQVVAFTIGTPAQVTPSTVAISANGSLRLDDRARLSNLVATNIGSGTTQIGVQTAVGSVVTQAPVAVAPRASVTALTYASSASIDPTASVASQVPNAVLTPTQTLTWSAHFAPCTNDIVLQNQANLAPAPGSYCAVAINAGSTLRLTAGTYYAQSLHLESQSTLLIDDSAGPVILYVNSSLQWKGHVRAVANHTPRLFTAYAGTEAVPVISALAGTLVAPYATVTLSDAVDSNVGSVAAQSVEIGAGVQLTFAPSPLTNADLGALGTPELIAARHSYARFVGDPRLGALVSSVLSTVSNLTPYQTALLNLTLYLNQNSALLEDPSQLTSAQLQQLPAFTAAVQNSPAMQAIVAAGANLRSDPAALNAAINSFATRASQPVPTAPPPHGQSCGGVTPNVSTAANTFASAQASTVRAASTLVLADGAISSDGIAATLLPVSTLANLSLPGTVPDGFWDVVKGVTEVASAACAVAAAVVAVVPCGVCQGVAAGLAIASGVLAGVAGTIDLVQGAQSDGPNACPGTAPTCTSNANCAGTSGSDTTVCSFGCCAVASSSSALIASGIVACVQDSDCESNSCGADGCCGEVVVK